jgi:Mg/Co/Ni transporter MgtE
MSALDPNSPSRDSDAGAPLLGGSASSSSLSSLHNAAGHDGVGFKQKIGLLPAEASFGVRLRKRAGVLVALLVFQSCSSFILASFEELLKKHSVVVFFLTMLVGAGGNAGNQAAVLVIRGLATGEVSARRWRRYVWGEVQMAASVSLIMVVAGYLRVTAFGYSQRDAVAIAASLFLIVLTSVVTGSLLPLVLHWMRWDPAHAGATIQVIMDLAGVCITCTVCTLLLPP